MTPEQREAQEKACAVIIAAWQAGAMGRPLREIVGDEENTPAILRGAHASGVDALAAMERSARLALGLPEKGIEP